MNKVVFLPSYIETLKKLTDDEDQLELMWAIINYQYEGKEPNLYGTLDLLWTAIKPNIDITMKYQESGKKGGRPRKTPLETTKTPLFNNENPPLEIQKPNKNKNKKENKNMNQNKDENIEKEMSNIFTIEKKVETNDNDFNTLLEHAHLLNDYIKE